MQSVQRALLTTIIPLLLVAEAQAQQPAQPPAPAAEKDTDELRDKIDAQQKKLEALESKDTKRQSEVDVLKKELQALRDEREAKELEQLADKTEAKFKPSFRIYGFFDLTFGKNDFAEDSAAHLYVHNTLSFALTSVNIYFASQMTEKLSALTEVRLSYLPIGQTLANEVYLKQGNELVPLPGQTFRRVDTHVVDPTDSEEIDLGGIYLERVQLKYAPRDWFSIIAGRFLTPIGIWNVEHGSPVVIPVRLPFQQLRQMVPLAQTGLQVYGRLFPRDDLLFDYAFTFSNGRGPIDEVYDLDNNKGLGLRLKLTYESNNTTLSLGGFGYYGRYLDKKRDVIIDTENKELTTKAEPIDDYDEYSIAGDLLVQVFGLRLQSELVYRRVVHNVRRPLIASEMLYQVWDPVGVGAPYYKPDYYAMSLYALVAYELPDRWLKQVKITPYFMYEYSVADDTLDYTKVNNFIIAGLNIRPTPFLVLKLEFTHVNSDLFSMQSYRGQMAVSF